MDEEVLRRRLNDFQDLFSEARLCIDDARDSAETTYYDEEAEAAKEAVDAAVKDFEGIISDLR